MKSILVDAWPFALLGILGGIMINTDTLMLGWFKTGADVGFYSAAQKPIQLIYTVSVLISATVFPTLARFAGKNDQKFRHLLEITISLLLFLGVPLAVGGVFFGKEIILLLFGSGYLPATIAFQILMFTIIIIFPFYILGNALFAYDQQKQFIPVLAVGTIGNVILNYILIPPYGIAGAAAATIGAQFAANAFVWQKMKKINYFTVLPYLKNSLLATMIMIVVASLLKYLNIYFLVNIAIAVGVYLGLLVLLKEPLLKEIRNIIR